MFKIFINLDADEIVWDAMGNSNVTVKDSPSWIETVWRLYSAKIYKLCEIKSDSVEDAKDLFQTVALKFCQNAHRLQGKTFTYQWLIRVLCNARCDMVTERHATYPMSKMADYVERLSALSEEKSVFYRPQNASEDYEILYSVLNPLERMIVDLSYIGGFSSDELSSIVGLSAGAIRKRRLFALGKLRAKWFPGK